MSKAHVVALDEAKLRGRPSEFNVVKVQTALMPKFHEKSEQVAQENPPMFQELRRLQRQDGHATGLPPSTIRAKLIKYPHDALKLGIYWDYFVALVILYSLLMTPYYYIFHDGAKWLDGMLTVMIPLGEFVFLVDIVVQFRSAYILTTVNEQFVVDDGKLVFLHYLKGKFFWDFFSSFAYLLIQIFDQTGDVNFMRGARTLLLFRLFRVVRLSKTMYGLVEHLPSEVRAVFRVARILFGLALFSLWAGMYMYTMGEYYAESSECQDENIKCGWLVHQGLYQRSVTGTMVPVKDQQVQFIASWYFGMVTMLTIGYGDILPIEQFERLYAMLYMCLGVALVYPAIIGEVSMLISEVFDEKGQEKVAVAEAFISDNGLPETLGNRIRRHVEYTSKLGQSHSLAELVPVEMLADINMFLHKTTLQKIPMLQGVPSGFLRHIVGLMKLSYVMAGEDVFDIGDAARTLYLIRQGEVTLLDCNEQAIRVLARGASFGNLGYGAVQTFEYGVRCKFISMLYELSKDVLDEAGLIYPDTLEHIKRNAAHELTEIVESLPLSKPKLPRMQRVPQKLKEEKTPASSTSTLTEAMNAMAGLEKKQTALAAQRVALNQKIQAMVKAL